MARATRWTILHKACLEVDPNCKVAVNAKAKADASARLDSLTPETFQAELTDTVDFMARMRARTLEIWAAFYAEMALHASPAYQAESVPMAQCPRCNAWGSKCRCQKKSAQPLQGLGAEYRGPWRTLIRYRSLPSASTKWKQPSRHPAVNP